MPIAIIPMGLMSRDGHKNQFSNGWYLTDLNDPSRTCTHMLLHSRKHDNVCSNYYPGVPILDRPTWYADIVNDEEWKCGIRKFNEALMNWWTPGDLCRSVAVFLGSFTLVPLIFYCACDERGQLCFVNRKKIQALRVMKDVCEELNGQLNGCRRK
jgi:hypothetical protein